MIEIESMGWVLSFDSSAVLAPGMFLTLILALLSGFPVAFCLGGIGVIFALLGMLTGEIEPQFVTALPQRILGIMGNFTLLAIPAFVFMGSMLESSGIAERLLESMGRLLGRVRGGLALAVVLVGSLLAATTGVVREWAHLNCDAARAHAGQRRWRRCVTVSNANRDSSPRETVSICN